MARISYPNGNTKDTERFLGGFAGAAVGVVAALLLCYISPWFALSAIVLLPLGIGVGTLLASSPPRTNNHSRGAL